MSEQRGELRPEELRWQPDLGNLSFETTDELQPLDCIIGQERAVRALEFGLEVDSLGYNIYVAGQSGVGKLSTCLEFCRRAAEGKPVPNDIVFVHNFSTPERPLWIDLPRGRGRKLRQDMEELVNTLAQEIPRAFEGEEFEQRRKEIVERTQRLQQALFNELEERAREQGFALKGTQMGFILVPLVAGEPIKEEKYKELPEGVRAEIERKRIEFGSQVNEFLKKAKSLEKEARQKLAELERGVALFAVGHMINELREEYQDFPKVMTHLDAVQEHILANLGPFRGGEEETAQAPAIPKRQRLEEAFSVYRVNIIVDNAELNSPPVINETNPNYNNLFGRIEKRSIFGTLVTDFNMIRAGSMIRANGGFLVVNALDVLLNPGTWPALKRSIRNQEVRIEELAEQYGFAWTGGIKPEPVPVNVKVIMIGSPHIYHLLYALDEDFRKVLKVKVDFDHNMKRCPENIEGYACFIASRCKGEGLLPFNREAVGRVLQHGVRLGGDKDKLTSRFGEVVDIVREASFWARKEGSPFVRALDVQKAIDEKEYRSNLLEEKIQELIEEGTLMVDLEGAVVGQVNGLSVYDIGDFSFGKPSRITARTFMGEKGVINIERESKLSGRIHDKGVLILSGYLGGKYARNRPLSLSASICFEQSYEGVEGDSASTAELYALTSHLSGLPIKQGIAVTGSVNQRGEVQPIGGVNEKIEGFFDVCKVKELTGDQGVIIPHQNVKNLGLKQEVVDAVAEGRFHIYPIRSIDEGLKILTGVEAGELLPDGTYPPGSVHGEADARLGELYQEMRRGRRRAEREEEEEEEEASERA